MCFVLEEQSSDPNSTDVLTGPSNTSGKEGDDVCFVLEEQSSETATTSWNEPSGLENSDPIDEANHARGKDKNVKNEDQTEFPTLNDDTVGSDNEANHNALNRVLQDGATHVLLTRKVQPEGTRGSEPETFNEDPASFAAKVDDREEDGRGVESVFNGDSASTGSNEIDHQTQQIIVDANTPSNSSRQKYQPEARDYSHGVWLLTPPTIPRESNCNHGAHFLIRPFHIRRWSIRSEALGGSTMNRIFVDKPSQVKQKVFRCQTSQTGNCRMCIVLHRKSIIATLAKKHRQQEQQEQQQDQRRTTRMERNLLRLRWGRMKRHLQL